MNTTIENIPNRHRGRTIAGAIILLIGSALLIDQLDLLFIPDWVFSWASLIILIGLYVGAKHNFQNISWLIIVFIGGAFLADDIFPALQIDDIIWPAALILLGVYLVMRRSHYFKAKL